METIRLYRALHQRETALGYLESYDFENESIIDEAYSHILDSYPLKDERGERTIFSFTADLSVAVSLVKDNSLDYDSIAYIDAPISRDANISRDAHISKSAFFSSNENTLSPCEDSKARVIIKPVFRAFDWFDMAIYCQKLSLSNLNITRLPIAPIPLINTLIPSRNGALSKARAMNEFAVFFRGKFAPRLLDLDDEEALRAEIEKSFQQPKLEDEENLGLFFLSNPSLLKSNTARDIIKSLRSYAEDEGNLTNVGLSRRQAILAELKNWEGRFFE